MNQQLTNGNQSLEPTIGALSQLSPNGQMAVAVLVKQLAGGGRHNSGVNQCARTSVSNRGDPPVAGEAQVGAILPKDGAYVPIPRKAVPREGP